MRIVQGIVAFVTAVTLAATFIAAGLAVCLAPPITHALSSLFADDATSPFSRAQLVKVADATREFSFGAHDEAALYRAILQVDDEYRQTVLDTGGKVPDDFPAIDKLTATASLDQMRSAFNGASEMYCYSADTVAHLDDCYRLAASAFPLVVVGAAVALVGLVFTGVTGRKRWVGGVFLVAGIVVIVSFIALAVWAGVDFAGFFAVLHGIFFRQGSWQFPYDSLLICSLPTPFWMGMGFIWLLVTLIVCIIAIFLGITLLRSRRR